MKITAVEILRLRGPAPERPSWYRQSRPLAHYPEHAPTSRWQSRSAHPGVQEADYLQIRAGDHLGLYGPVDRPASTVVTNELRDFLIGKDPRAIAIVWDQMYRRDRHSRSSYPMMAISAVDNALWDLAGRLHGVPVYELLGGPRAATVEAYASTLGTSLDEGAAEDRARALADNGFAYQKWFFAYGPGDGPAGMTANVDLARRLRTAVGDDVELMFDAFMSWNLPYAREWLRRAGQFRPYWLEEPLPPDQLEATATLNRESEVPISAGEHLYGRWEAQRYLAAGAVSILQSDPEWCGGVSELVHISTVGSLHGVPVIPHGHGIRAALHVVASQPPSICPRVEYLLEFMPFKLHFEQVVPTPVDGRITLGTEPGFGIAFDESRIDDIRTL
ncbi:enolase C-terminal domain-like protein [Actinopolymorpha sp. B17G11]|uniref:enolase C-terminal domain-like protein n=1 Tax=Actinopolymorpha sp. B17G11 TaxID=3160861 RepID=UPI0032E3CA3A